MKRNSDLDWLLKAIVVILIVVGVLRVITIRTQVESVTVPTQTTRAWTVADSKAYAHLAIQDQADKEFSCLKMLWKKESSWRSTADNPRSSAYGIAQLLGEKSKDPTRQIDQGLKYIYHRHGTPCAAWTHWKSKGWY